MYTSKKFEDLTISDDFMFGIVTHDLSEAVESAKRNEKWRLDYMTLQMAYDEKYTQDIPLCICPYRYSYCNEGSSERRDC